MNAPTKLLLALTAAAALSFAYPARANLITNGGFETGDFTGWFTDTFQVKGAFGGVSPHTGNFQAVGFGGPILAQTLATMAGQSYTVDFWAATNSASGFFEVLWGGSTVFSHAFAGPTGYTEFTFNVTASSASTEIRFRDDNGNLFIDDVSVNQRAGVPDTGSTVSLLGCALLSLATLRRKLSC